MKQSWLAKFAVLLIPLTLIIGCVRDRQVVPYDVDTDKVYEALSPNDDSSPENPTFGPQNIQGAVFDYEMTTESSDVYVFFENLTLLDVDASINSDIFEFIEQQLSEFGFIDENYSFPKDEVSTLEKEGMNFSQTAAKILDNIKAEFEKQVPTLLSYQSPFNIYFQIYPVFLNNDYVTYRESAYCFTGGAHGVSISYLKTYDLASGKRMTTEDIIKPERLGEVREEVAAQMAYSYPIYENIKTVGEYIDSLNVWLDNFDDPDRPEKITLDDYPLSVPAITEEGLVFIYQMYELTPGSDGCPLVVIPYKDLKGCLRPEIGL